MNSRTVPSPLEKYSETCILILCVFFFNDTATTEIYTLSLHDALPIWFRSSRALSSVERLSRFLRFCSRTLPNVMTGCGRRVASSVAGLMWSLNVDVLALLVTRMVSASVIQKNRRHHSIGSWRIARRILLSWTLTSFVNHLSRPGKLASRLVFVSVLIRSSSAAALSIAAVL